MFENRIAPNGTCHSSQYQEKAHTNPLAPAVCLSCFVASGRRAFTLSHIHAWQCTVPHMRQNQNICFLMLTDIITS